MLLEFLSIVAIELIFNERYILIVTFFSLFMKRGVKKSRSKLIVILFIGLVISVAVLGYFLVNEKINKTENKNVGLSPVSNICSGLDNQLKQTSSWTLLGPSDGRVNTIEFGNSGEILIGTSSGGIFRSLDGGNNWEHFSNGLVSKEINYLKNINGKIYAATDDGIYLLESSSWKNIFRNNSDFPPQLDNFLLIDYDQDGKIWAITTRHLFFSPDGLKWSSVTTPSLLTNNEMIKPLLVSKKGAIYVGGQQDLLMSLDNGNSWKRIFGGVISITEDELGTIYFISLDRHVYKKLWNQDNIEELTAYYPSNGDAVITYFNGSLFTEGFNFLRVSLDKGKTFEDIITSKNEFWDIRQIYPLKDKRIILANDNGISEINLNTKIIKRYSPVSNYSEINSLALIPTQDIILTSYWDHNSIASKDCLNWNIGLVGGEGSFYFAETKAGQTFVKVENGLHLFDTNKLSFNSLLLPLWSSSTENTELIEGRYSTSFDITKNPPRVYSIYEENGKTVLLSFDMINDSSRLNLNKQTLPFSFSKLITVDSNNGNRILIFAYGGIYESLDKGLIWKKMVDIRTSVDDISINPFNGSEIILGGGNGDILFIKNNQVSSVYFSTDESKRFNNPVYSVSYDDKYPNTIYVGSQKGFFFSNDNGLTWKEFNNGLYSAYIREVIPFGDKIFIGTWGSGNAVILKEKLLSFCTDSDGNNINIKGTTTGWYRNPLWTADQYVTYTDSCIGNLGTTNQYVREWICQSAGSTPEGRTPYLVPGDYVCPSGCLNGACIASPKPKAYYKFDEVSGNLLTTILDSSGNNKVGTLFGNVVRVPGKNGTALKFAGNISSYAKVVGLYSSTQSYSLSVWLKPEQVGRRQLFLTYGGNVCTQYMTMNQDGQFYYSHGNATSYIQSNFVGTNTKAVNGTWINLATSYNGTTLKTYINGVLIKTVITNVPYTMNGDTYFGGTCGIPWYGAMDEIKIYDQTLSDQQVKDIYDGKL